MDINERFALWEKKYKPHGEHEELLYIIAKDAVAALSSPHPEAREEDEAIAKLVEEWGQVCIIADKRGVCVQYETGDDDFRPPFASHEGKTLHEALEASGALSRLAAPKPEARTISWQLINDIIDETLEEEAAPLECAIQVILAANGYTAINEPAAPEPRSAEEPKGINPGARRRRRRDAADRVIDELNRELEDDDVRRQ